MNEKKYIVTKEFFGGIIEDIKKKENMSIDSSVYSVLDRLLNSEKERDVTHMSSEEVWQILDELVELEIVKLNYSIKNAHQENTNCLSHPLRVFYDITYKCNLACKHCFTNSGKKREEELSLPEKKKLINQFKEANVGRISIAGGEPFASEDIFFFLAECKENDIEVSITSNGTLLDEYTVKRLNDIKIRTLTISLDGASQEGNDFIRGLGSYKKTLEGLDNLKKYYKNNYCIKTTLMKSNLNDIEELIKIAISKGCWSIKFNCVREDGRAHKNSEEIVLDSREYIDVIKRIETLKKKYGDRIDIKAPLNIFCEEDYEFIPELGFGCFAGKESICIDPMGNVRPCSHFPSQFICGNIREESLIEMWRSNKILQLFRNLEGNKECNSCKSYKFCRGGCRFRAYKNGDINGIDPYCYLEKGM